MSKSPEAINISVKIHDRSHERRIRMIDRRNLEYQRFCRYFSLPYFGTRVRTKTSVWIKCTSKKELAQQAKNRERLRKRIIHHYNELSPDEEGVHCCMVFGELLEKNPDIQINLSKHRGLREALGSQEVRRTLVEIGSIFVGAPGYNWELGTSTFTSHLLPTVPCNSDFHNAELAHIAIKSHRRSAYDLQRARGKRNRRSHRLVDDGHQLQLQSKCPIIIILRRFKSSPEFFKRNTVFKSIWIRFYILQQCATVLC